MDDFQSVPHLFHQEICLQTEPQTWVASLKFSERLGLLRRPKTPSRMGRTTPGLASTYQIPKKAGSIAGSAQFCYGFLSATWGFQIPLVTAFPTRGIRQQALFLGHLPSPNLRIKEEGSWCSPGKWSCWGLLMRVLPDARLSLRGSATSRGSG